MPLTLVTIEESLHPELLTQPATEVAFPLSEADQQVIHEMKLFVEKHRAVGLAAPQLGVAKQIFVMSISADAIALRGDGNETIDSLVLINPDYTPTADAKVVHDWEACFSVKHKTGKVPRYNKITYRGQTVEGKSIEAIATGFTARVLQHEIDHLKGILIIDRLTPDCIQGTPEEMQSIRLNELTPKQQAIAQKIIAEREKNLKE